MMRGVGRARREGGRLGSEGEALLLSAGSPRADDVRRDMAYGMVWLVLRYLHSHGVTVRLREEATRAYGAVINGMRVESLAAVVNIPHGQGAAMGPWKTQDNGTLNTRGFVSNQSNPGTVASVDGVSDAQLEVIQYRGPSTASDRKPETHLG